MTKRWTAVLSGVVLLAAIAAPVFAADAAKPAEPAKPAAPAAPVVKPANEGDPIPNFNITMLSGGTKNSVELASKNKTMIITFIQTACSACKGEIVELNILAKDAGDKVLVVPIAVDMRSGKEFLENYKSENAVAFDFGIDPKFTIPRMFNLSFTPASVLIKEGKVVKIFRGYDEEIKKELTAAFK